jgi:hypothetical protein
MLFEYVIVGRLRNHAGDVTKERKILVDRTTVVAKDEAHAKLAAACAIPEEWRDRLDQVEVLVRPFCP